MYRNECQGSSRLEVGQDAGTMVFVFLGAFGFSVTGTDQLIIVL